MPGKRKQMRDKWKIDRKVALSANRKQKAIRFVKAAAKAKAAEEKTAS
ncbi:MAG: hypothetical protein HQ488_03520 [Parcubacteria group bacterium]|nr:hypothetical protein [Parcubacteria group bacterium]